MIPLCPTPFPPTTARHVDARERFALRTAHGPAGVLKMRLRANGDRTPADAHLIDLQIIRPRWNRVALLWAGQGKDALMSIRARRPGFPGRIIVGRRTRGGIWKAYDAGRAAIGYVVGRGYCAADPVAFVPGASATSFAAALKIAVDFRRANASCAYDLRCKQGSRPAGAIAWLRRLFLRPADRAGRAIFDSTFEASMWIGSWPANGANGATGGAVNWNQLDWNKPALHTFTRGNVPWCSPANEIRPSVASLTSKPGSIESETAAEKTAA